MSEPSRRVALSFLAHPDDAEILCDGTLIRLADADVKCGAVGRSV
jgi:LmbE family N-acetylglucosaminyl deacetylase